jgi:hypothetical protein
MELGQNLIDGPPPTLLPEDSATLADLAAGMDPDQIVRRHPASSLAWAVLAEQAWAQDQVMEAYAFSRVGYHRGLDALRRNGWKGHGAVPWSHEPNQGFLRCLQILGRASRAIEETAETERINALILDCDPTLSTV